MSLDALESRLDKIYDRLEGQFTRVSLNDGSRKSLSNKQFLRLLVAAITAAVNEDKAWLQSEDAVFLQSVVPGQDTTIDLVQRIIAGIKSF